MIKKSRYDNPFLPNSFYTDLIEQQANMPCNFVKQPKQKGKVMTKEYKVQRRKGGKRHD